MSGRDGPLRDVCPRPGRGYPGGVLVVCAAGFATLVTLILLGVVGAADVAVRETLLAWASPAFVGWMRVVNHAGEWRVLAPGTALLFVAFPHARRRWWVWVALMVVAPLAEGALKVLIGQPRPEGAALGFPSGHVTAAAAYFGAVAYLAGSLRTPAARVAVRVLAFVAVGLVAVARVVLRAHWPSDALGGIALGLVLASAAMLAASAQPPGVER